MKTYYIILSTIIMAFTSCTQKENMKQGIYEGEEISDIARIYRDKESKACFLTIDTEGSWSLYAGKQVESIDFSQPILKGDKTGTYPVNINDSIRYYFQLNTEKGKGILAETHLPMTGGFNFRDLGGIRTQDGHHVKWGKFIRTDELHQLTEADLRYLSSIPIISVVDFRGQMEIDNAPDILPASVKNAYPLSIHPGNILELQDIAKSGSLNLEKVMITINEYLVSDSTFINQYKEFFSILQDESKVPVIFHCTAGKDRTGMGAALILFALGVNEEMIYENYLASNIYLKEKYAEDIRKNPQMEAVLTVKKEFLEAGINKIKELYGTPENYLTQKLGVDIERFREMYLD
ncbi:tyrosine-protein phosphatase [Bacteroides sp. 224]|uniref:tyrosine-protein phosphatase n=1 Tax=Bacteroides sp. 224 TaxID=2302936 RepID=UPI0013CFC7FC|nr:tyrosine-protein phosphatase [Bacteroides sp. 224]NDV64098.1 tyrosine-protein phosphatase [Bacteroides sp. 224]